MNVRNYLNRIIFLATELLLKIDNLLKLCKFKFVLKIYEKRKKLPINFKNKQNMKHSSIKLIHLYTY